MQCSPNEARVSGSANHMLLHLCTVNNFDSLSEQLFTCKLGGRKVPRTWANRLPTPGILPRLVNGLFSVILWPVEVVW